MKELLIPGPRRDESWSTTENKTGNPPLVGLLRHWNSVLLKGHQTS